MKPSEELRHAYSLKICRGPGGCPHAVIRDRDLADGLEGIFTKLDYDGFIKARIDGPLRIHHQFKVSISCCPNACSQPQIVDLGFIGADPVVRTGNPCSFCNACVEACGEDAVFLDPDLGPKILQEKCLFCGKCALACPTQAIGSGAQGFRIMAGGKLGRHPRLATEIPGTFPKPEALAIAEAGLRLFMENYAGVKRFADLFTLFTPEQVFDKILKPT